MATGSVTKTTQTEEEEDYSHLTAKDVNFKCPGGMNARLDKFKVVNKKAFVVQLELDSKTYNGWFIEANDSFAPVNLVTSKRGFPGGRRRLKKRRSVVMRAKKPNVYSRENYPQGFVDTYNTIKARLRYGRDIKNHRSSTLPVEGNSSLQSKGGNVLSVNRKKKSMCFVADSVSNEDSPFQDAKYNVNRRYLKGSLKRKEYDSVSEATSNENSSSTRPVFMIPSTPGYNDDASINCTHDGDISAASSDTSFYSLETMMQNSTSKYKENQTATNSICSENTAQGQSSNQRPGRDLMTFSPRIDTGTQCKDNNDAVQTPASYHVSSYQSPEPDLITFSPSIDTEKTCRSNETAVLRASSSKVSWSQSLETDLIMFSPRINAETQCKKNDDVTQRSSVIQFTKNKSPGSKLQVVPNANETIQDLNGWINVKCTSSDIVSNQRPLQKPEYRLDKLGDIRIKKYSILHPNKNSFNQSLESDLQNTPARKRKLYINDNISEKITSKEDHDNSPELKLQYSLRNAGEIHWAKDLNNFDTPTLSKDEFYQSNMKNCPRSYKEMLGIIPDTDSKRALTGKFNQRFESFPRVDTRGISDESNEQRSSNELSNLCFEFIPQNYPKKGSIRVPQWSHSANKTAKCTEENIDTFQKLSERSLQMNYEIRCTYDGAHMQKITSCDFPFQNSLESETLSCSGKEETELYFREINAQSAISREYSTRQRAKCRLKSFQQNIKTQISCNNDIPTEEEMTADSYRSPEYKPQSSFKDGEPMRLDIEDSNVQREAQNEICNEIPGKMHSFSEDALIQDSIEPKLLRESRKIECVVRDIGNDALADALNEMTKLFSIKKHEETLGGTENNVESIE